MDAPFPEGMLREIEEVLRLTKKQKPGKDLYPEVFNFSCVMPLQRKNELKQMMATARKVNPKVIMEIGADKGGGLFHWVKCFSPERVVACEIRGTPYSELFEKAFPEIDFLWLPESSYDPVVVQKVNHWLGLDAFDCVFIDGDKANFMADFNAYKHMVKKGGIAFMHDIQDDAPGTAFEQAKTDPAVLLASTIIDISEGTEAKQRENEGLPSTGCYENWLRIWGGRSCGVGVLYLDATK